VYSPETKKVLTKIDQHANSERTRKEFEKNNSKRKREIKNLPKKKGEKHD
jgi:hypothetical protein